MTGASSCSRSLVWLGRWTSGRGDIVEPDLLWIAADQLGIITKKHVRGVPALVIEIMSPGTRQRDRRFKRDLYARTGVR